MKRANRRMAQEIGIDLTGCLILTGVLLQGEAAPALRDVRNEKPAHSPLDRNKETEIKAASNNNNKNDCRANICRCNTSTQ